MVEILKSGRDSEIWSKLSSGGATYIYKLRGNAQSVSSLSIELISSSTRDTSVKSTKHYLVSDGQRFGPIDRTPGIPVSGKNGGSYVFFTMP